MHAQSLDNKRVEKFRIDASELPDLLEDLDLDAALVEAAPRSGEIEVMRITESGQNKAFLFEFDDEEGGFEFLGRGSDGIQIEMDLSELEESMEELEMELERLGEDIEESIHKNIHININKDGEEHSFDWNGEGEMPEELKDRLEDLEDELEDLDIDIDIDFDEDCDDQTKVFKMKTKKSKPFLGVYHENSEDGGVRVTGVVDGSAAELSGIEKNDRIIDIDGEGINNVSDLRDVLQSKEVGQTVRVALVRDNKPTTVNATLGGQKEKTSTSNNWNFNKNKNAWKPRHRKAMFGVNLNTDDNEVIITDVHRNSNAENIGVEDDDIIISFDDEDINSYDALRSAIRSMDHGDSYTVKVDRDGTMKTLRGTWEGAENNVPRNRTMFFGKPAKQREVIIIRPVSDLSEEERNLGFGAVNVFPNPSSGLINVSFSGNNLPAEIRVTGANGQTIQSMDVTPVRGRINEQITLDRPVEGTLFISVIQGDEIYTERIVNE